MGSSVILPAPGQPKTGPDSGFKTASVPNVVTFGLDRIGPPSPLYIQRDDILVFDAISDAGGEVVTFNGRLLLAPFPRGGQPDSGPSTDPTATAQSSNIIESLQAVLNLSGAPRTFASGNLPLSEGYLLSLSASAQSAGQRGQTFVRVFILRGRTVAPQVNTYLPLFSGYVNQTGSIGWPYGRAVDPSEGYGTLKTLQVANPAAGSDWTFTVPNQVRVRVQSLAALLTTSAAVANRNVVLIIDDGTNVYWESSLAASIAATTAQTVVATGTNVPTGVVTTISELVIPPGLWLPTGHRIRTATVNIQAADQWSNIFLGVEQLFDSV